MTTLSVILIILGLLFFTGGSIGIVRYPDFYSRLHPAGKLDTGGLVITLSGVTLYTLSPLSFSALITSCKILLIIGFVFITSPTAIHAIVDAGVRAGLPPWEKEEIHDLGD